MTHYKDSIMSEKQQGTSCGLREKMLSKYADGLHHKHNKNHSQFRHHYKSHPVQPLNGSNLEESLGSTGLVREYKLRKLRTRLDKGCFH
jgi:hypothetical protein